VDICAHDAVDQEIASQPRIGVGPVRAQYDVGLEAKTPSGGSRCAAMVGLDAADGDDRIAPLAKRLCKQKLELSDLVPTQFAARDVVALDPELALRPVDTREFPVVQGRWQCSQPNPRGRRGDGAWHPVRLLVCSGPSMSGDDRGGVPTAHLV
jgi:hypothetical protein